MVHAPILLLVSAAWCPLHSQSGGIAHCITGERRTFDAVAPSIRQNLIEPLGSPAKIFIALSDETAIVDAKLAAALKEVNGSLVETAPLTRPDHGCTVGSLKPGSGFYQWATMARCYQQVELYEQQHQVCFSHVVRSRTDVLWTQPMIGPIAAYSSTAISVRWANQAWGKLKTAGLRSAPTWLDDNFAIVPRALASIYFGTVRGYSRCRTCESYAAGCKGGSTPVSCTKELVGTRQHVGSECLLAMWLSENGVHEVMQLRDKASPSSDREAKFDIVRRQRVGR